MRKGKGLFMLTQMLGESSIEKVWGEKANIQETSKWLGQVKLCLRKKILWAGHDFSREGSLVESWGMETYFK